MSPCPSHFLFSLGFFPLHTNVLTSLLIRLPTSLLIFIVQVSGTVSCAHRTPVNSILLTERNKHNLNSTGNPTYNLLNKQIPPPK